MLWNIWANSYLYLFFVLSFSFQFVESDCDSELLINIPFTSNIKLKGLRLIGGEGDSHPSRIKLFKNRPGMTFDDVNAACDRSAILGVVS